MIPNKIKDFISEVCDNVQWVKSHNNIAKELGNHITDQSEDYMELGMSKTESIDRAILEMGNPMEIGLELNKVHRPQSQWKLLLFTSLMVFVGLFLRLNFSYENISQNRDIGFTLIGLCLMMCIYFVDISNILKHVSIIYILTLFFVSLGLFSAQPLSVSIAKFVYIFPLVYSLIVYSQRNKRYWGYAKSILFALPMIFLIMYTRSALALITFSVIAFTLLVYAIGINWFATDKRMSYIILFMLTGFTGFFLYYISSSYAISRLQFIFSDDSYFASTVRETLANSVFFGTGNVGEFLTSWENRLWYHAEVFLLYMVHELGLFSLIILIGGFIGLIYHLISKAFKHSTKLGKFIAFPIIMIYLIQAISYTLYNLGFHLFAPVAFPFISYSGAMQVVNLMLLGILLSTFRFSGVMEDGVNKIKINIISS